MGEKRRRITFEASPDMVGLLDEAQEVCHGRTRSETIKTLLAIGLEESKTKRNGKDPENTA